MYYCILKMLMTFPCVFPPPPPLPDVIFRCWTWCCTEGPYLALSIHRPEDNLKEDLIFLHLGGGGAEVTYYWRDKRGIMVILRRARPPASAPTSNESWFAFAGFVSNQLSCRQFNKEKLQSQPAGNTACKYLKDLSTMLVLETCIHAKCSNG